MSDSIFRRASHKRDASLLAQQLDGTHMTLTIYDMNLKSESRAIYTLSSDMTINRIRTGKNEIKWLKLKKILDPILPYIDNETLTYYFSKAQKETLIKVYQERE